MGNSMTPDYATKEEYFQAAVNKDSHRNSIFGGPMGLGDPEDKYLYKKEIMFGLPAKRKEIILDEYCSKPNQDFLACRKENKILSKFRCRNENLERFQCIHHFWDLPGLEERAHNEYLAARSNFRQTGNSQLVMSDWAKKTTFSRKSWEEYNETKDDNINLWALFANLWRKQESPIVSAPIDPEPLNNS